LFPGVEFPFRIMIGARAAEATATMEQVPAAHSAEVARWWAPSALATPAKSCTRRRCQKVNATIAAARTALMRAMAATECGPNSNGPATNALTNISVSLSQSRADPASRFHSTSWNTLWYPLRAIYSSAAAMNVANPTSIVATPRQLSRLQPKSAGRDGRTGINSVGRKGRAVVNATRPQKAILGMAYHFNPRKKSTNSIRSSRSTSVGTGPPPVTRSPPPRALGVPFDRR